ncbi:MAG: helix-turn-helix domain-containing protein, partial [Planctomycetota bacterium]
LLAEHFLALEAAEVGKEPRALGDAARKALEAYAWPGNVRELRNEMRRLVLLGEEEVQFEELSPAIQENAETAGGDPGPEFPLPERVRALEIAAITSALEKEPGNRSRAAKLLGITRFALLRKIEKYSLLKKEPEEPASAEGGGS